MGQGRGSDGHAPVSHVWLPWPPAPSQPFLALAPAAPDLSTSQALASVWALLLQISPWPFAAVGCPPCTLQASPPLGPKPQPHPLPLYSRRAEASSPEPCPPKPQRDRRAEGGRRSHPRAAVSSLSPVRSSKSRRSHGRAPMTAAPLPSRLASWPRS